MPEDEKSSARRRRLKEEKEGLKSRRDFLIWGARAGIAGLGILGVGKLLQWFQSKESSVRPNEDINEEKIVLAKGEVVTLGRLNVINHSEKVDLVIFPGRLSDDFKTKAGLKVPNAYPISLKLTDAEDADPSTSEKEGAATVYNPETGDRQGFVAIGFFLGKTKHEKALPNSPLTTAERFNNYLSVLLSQAGLVEISNQGHVEEIDPNSLQSKLDLDKRSNELGKEYVNEIISGEAQPFIVVTRINP